jgi:hypothetical protein
MAGLRLAPVWLAFQHDFGCSGTEIGGWPASAINYQRSTIGHPPLRS